MQLALPNFDVPFSAFGFTRKELMKLGLLVMATSFAAALAIPLEMASLPPDDIPLPVGLRERMRIEEHLREHYAEVSGLSKKERDREGDLRRFRMNQIASLINSRFEDWRSKWNNDSQDAAAAARWLLFSRLACAFFVLLLFVVLPWMRNSLTVAGLIPLTVSMVTLASSIESGSRVAIILSAIWAVAACVGKIAHDNRQLRLKRPSWPKVAAGVATLLPIFLGAVFVCCTLGNAIESYLAQKVFETEAILEQGVDAGSSVVEQASQLRGRWWDPREWLFWCFVRHGAREYGRPAIAAASLGVRASYSFAKSVYRVLQYLSVLSLCWIVVRSLLFLVCRSFLYGGGAFMFHLPTTPTPPHTP